MRRSVRDFAILAVLAGGIAAVDACTVFDGLAVDQQTQGVGPGGNPNGADDGQTCNVGFDCKSGQCTGGICVTATTTACQVNTECGSGTCKDGKCLPVSATNGIKDGDETDVDCGGTQAGKCATDKVCKVAGDCDSGVCTGGKCQAPTATDQVKNGDETDVDCGGTTTKAPKCAVGKSCVKHEDCAIDGCDDEKKCATGRSCTQKEGGRTCGAGSTEPCCGSMPIPGGTTKLDVYKVTAGRMRAFVERTNGNVKGWYQTAKATLTEAQVAQIDPYVEFLPTDKTSQPYGTDYMLGGTIYLPKRPSESQGCFVGNAANQANGAHTYWNGTFEGEDRAFDQKFLDQLPLNCVTYPIAAAFCAWDGGRLQTFEENSAALGAGPYPWGATPQPGGFAVVAGTFTKVGPATDSFSMAPCPTCDENQMNWRNNYQNPPDVNGVPRAKPWDYAYWISAPGKFPKDVGAGGHKDIGGLMMELTATTTTVDPSPDGGGQMRVKWSRQGSWEGHAIGTTSYQFSVMTKYGKTGLRCARD